jgi:lysozyme
MAAHVRGDDYVAFSHANMSRPDHVVTRCEFVARAAALTALVLLVGTSCDRETPPASSERRPPPVNSQGPASKAARPAKNRLSPTGLERLRVRESFRARAYDDGVGNKTIGYGHMIRRGESFAGGITEAKARELFEHDVSSIAHRALDSVTVPLTQNQVDALGSFIFNVGPGNFARSVLPALNARDFERAKTQITRFTKGRNQRSGQLKALRGLTQRRREEVALFNAPEGRTALSPPGAHWSRAARRLLATMRHSPSMEHLCSLGLCGRAASPS